MSFIYLEDLVIDKDISQHLVVGRLETAHNGQVDEVGSGVGGASVEHFHHFGHTMGVTGQGADVVTKTFGHQLANVIIAEQTALNGTHTVEAALGT